MSLLTTAYKLVSTLFDGGIKEIGDAIDRFVTTDEERIKLKNETLSIMNDLKIKNMTHVENLEAELTKRHENDMKSDSWLSKNVRPMTLIFLVFMTTSLIYLTLFVLPSDKVKMLEVWIPLLITMVTTVLSFYFGSRGLEKIRAINNDSLAEKLKAKEEQISELKKEIEELKKDNRDLIKEFNLKGGK